MATAMFIHYIIFSLGSRCNVAKFQWDLDDDYCAQPSESFMMIPLTKMPEDA